MRTLGLLRERWIAFWRAANDLALVMDADPFEDIYGRVARLEAAVHGRAAAHPVPGSPAPSQDSSPAESRMASNQRKRGAMQVRKVVTGHDAEGRAVIARDEKIDGMPIPGLGELVFLWSADEPATYPNSGDNPAAPALFPPVGGIRFVIASYSPGFEAVAAPEAAPGIHVEEGDELGMHTTDSTDFGILLSGNVVLELDDGAEVSLSPGDVVVQNGTRHRWRVVGDVPATLAAFIIGAHRR